MMFLNSLFPVSTRASPENPSTNLNNPATWLTDALGGTPTSSSVRVNETTALQYSTVFACVRVLAETLAQLPLVLYRQSGGRKEEAKDHPLYKLVHDAPNEDMTSFTWRETVQAHLATWGNGYSVIRRRANARAFALYPMLPDRTTVARSGSETVYKTQIDGQSVTLGAYDVLHVPGLGFDGLVGYSPIRKARESIGVGMAATEFGGRFFQNGANIGGVIQVPGGLSDQAYERLRSSFSQVYSGLSNANKTAILEEGATFSGIGIPPDDAQFLETRKFQRSEIAGIFRIPPHFIGDLDRATFSNIEHQDLSFTKHTMLPWLVRWEQELNRKLLTEREQGRYFFKFKIDGLLRGDQKSRYESYHIAIADGWLSRNEAREFENRNPVDGLDEYLRPLNMASVDEEPEQVEPVAETEEPRAISLDVFEPLLRSAIDRIVTREGKAVMRLVRKYGYTDELVAEIAEFYEANEAYCRQQLEPIIEAMSCVDQSLEIEAEHKRLVGKIRAGASRYLATGADKQNLDYQVQVWGEPRTSEFLQFALSGQGDQDGN